jgi:hypothetical protein
VHAILGERIPPPNLVVYLKASTDTLMARIAMRDRPYERQMDRDYMHALRLTYEQYFNDYTTAPLLVVDTEHLDIVRDPDARSSLIGQVKNALEATVYQLPLLDVDIAMDEAEARAAAGLAARQRALRSGSSRAGPQQPSEDRQGQDLLMDYLALTGRLGDLAGIMGRLWHAQGRQLLEAGNRAEAQERAVAQVSAELEASLSTIFDQLLRLANDAGIDLERGYLQQHLGGRS